MAYFTDGELEALIQVLETATPQEGDGQRGMDMRCALSKLQNERRQRNYIPPSWLANRDQVPTKVSTFDPVPKRKVKELGHIDLYSLGLLKVGG